MLREYRRPCDVVRSDELESHERWIADGDVIVALPPDPASQHASGDDIEIEVDLRRFGAAFRRLLSADPDRRHSRYLGTHPMPAEAADERTVAGTRFDDDEIRLPPG